MQVEFVRTISGFENAHITRPGYAMNMIILIREDLKPSLRDKSDIQGLFFAGQINGTTGYEEAAAQGLIAGINAALQSGKERYGIPRRDEAYIGVLIDDLITRAHKSLIACLPVAQNIAYYCVKIMPIYV